MSMGRQESSNRRMTRAGRLVWLVAGVVLLISPLHVAGDGLGRARLVNVSTRIEGRATAVVIETSEPVAYVTAQPDPLTLLVDLRDVTIGSSPFLEKQKGVLSDLSVEAAKADDGTSIARVKLTLAKPGRPTVRSRWNTVIVEFGARLGDAAIGASGAGPRAASAVPQGESSAPAAAPQTVVKPPVKAPAESASPAAQKPSTAEQPGVVGTLTGIEITTGPDGTRVRFTGTGRLEPSSVEPTRLLPARLVIDFPQVLTKVPAVTAVGKGPIDKIRVAINSWQPLVTRAVIDLKYPVAHRVETTESGLTILLDPTPAVPPTPAPSPTPGVVPPQTPRPEPPPAAAPQPEVKPAPPAAPAPNVTIPAPAQATQADPSGQGVKKYTGHLISFDFQQADLRAVLRSFTEISGLNVIVDPSINGTVDIVLKDVPWDQALEQILGANKLGYTIENNVVRIAKLDDLAAEEAARQKLKEAQATSGELKVLTKTLSYAKAADMQMLLLKSVLTKRGDVQVDPRTNTLIISDLPAALERASQLVNTLDRPEPQVEVEARIVQTSRDSARALGVQWGLSGRAVPQLANTTPITFPNQVGVSGRSGGTSQTAQGGALNNAVNLGVTAASSAVGLAMGSVNGAFNLDVALSALEQKGNLRVLSSPRVMMQNNYEAEMTQGIQIPIQVVSNNTTTVTFKDAALTLKVRPQITASNTVIMDVKLENSSADFSKAVNGIPPINTQRAWTQVLVNDNDTIVIGGIVVSQEQAQNDKVPVMSRIPLLGWLFKRDSFTDENRELLIFITPRIRR
ncbi:MAG: type IV pilus secretin PilQ [Acidobacteria bacterium]|nr:type IV pilus secretin PilQ [Acidobacteriota bacterium]